MLNTSAADIETVIKLISENELGILLLKSDGASIFEKFAHEANFEDCQGMVGAEYSIAFHLYPLLYSSDLIPSPPSVRCRANAIKNVFERWTLKGYNKRKAKNPFSCKAFQTFLEEIEYTKADYMLLLVD